MLKKSDIQQLIALCQLRGKMGLKNGVSAQIPNLQIDILKSPNDFLGVNQNPAIFVNKYTYILLGRYHHNWVENQTIAIKAAFLSQPNKLEIIGALVHEVGHAFNIAANIANTEKNAYIFEIETLCNLLELEFLNNCSFDDFKDYFKSRLSYYKIYISTNPYLAKLVEKIDKQFNLDLNLPELPTLKSENNASNNLRFFEKTPQEESTIASNLTLT